MLLKTPLAITGDLVLAIQIVILVAGTVTRFSKFKDIGLYNKLLAWPKSYKLKLLIQVLNICIVIAQIVVLFVFN